MMYIYYKSENSQESPVKLMSKKYNDVYIWVKVQQFKV